MGSLKVFYSYSHKDEKFRESLESHLAILKRRGIITAWSDRNISAGQDWKKLIDDNIIAADVVLLLISSDFLASDYCYEKEMDLALERHERSESVVIPVILRPSDWSDTPFSRLQALPERGRPISTWDNEDEGWLSVVEGLKNAIETIQKDRLRGKEHKKFHGINELLRNEILAIDEAFRLEDRPTVRGISTGLADLDYQVDGICRSDLTVVAARPEMGCPSLARQIACYASTKANTSVAIFSLESSAERVVRHMMGLESKIPIDTLVKGSLTHDHWPKLEIGCRLLKDAPLYIDDSMSLTLPELMARCEHLVDSQNVRMIVIDNLQRIVFNEHAAGNKATSSDISKELRRFSRQKKVATILVCNLERDVEKRPNKRPIISDLGSFGTLYQDASLIVFVYRDEVYDDETSEKGVAELIIAKNDQLNRIGTIRVAYRDDYMRFDNLASEWPMS